jgi:hypothetical protein
MEAAFPTELSANIYQQTRRDILEVVLCKPIRRIRLQQKIEGRVLETPTLRGCSGLIKLGTIINLYRVCQHSCIVYNILLGLQVSV